MNSDFFILDIHTIPWNQPLDEFYMHAQQVARIDPSHRLQTQVWSSQTYVPRPSLNGLSISMCSRLNANAADPT